MNPNQPIDWARAARARSADGSPLFNIQRGNPAVTMTIRQWVLDFEAAHPQSFIVAADHRFTCTCDACIVFLVTTGLEAGMPGPTPDTFVVDKRWIALRDEPVTGTRPSPAQIAGIHALCEALL